MEKQKLADMVMQKMKQKKQLQEKNRPHYEVLRLEATFSRELNDILKESVTQLEKLLNQSRNTQAELQVHLNELDNTGKKSFPRIIVMPQFIASENVSADTKQFFRKSANSYLRTDLLRAKGYEESMINQKKMLENLNTVRQLENTIKNNSEEDRKIVNEKRLKVLKQSLRLRFIRQQQRNLRLTIQKEKEDNKDLLKQYEIKKLNLNTRKERLKYVENQIEVFKKKIEEKYNPVSYRELLEKMFAVQLKNQVMQTNLSEVNMNLSLISGQTKRFEKTLERQTSLIVLGRTSDSPSTKLGKIQKRLDQQRGRQNYSTARSLNNKSSMTTRSPSQSSVIKEKFTLDLASLTKSSGKISIMTTDRSSHKKHASSLSKALF